MNEKLVFDNEMEMSVLGAMIIDSSVIKKVSSILSIDCFYMPKNKDIYKAISVLDDSGCPIDFISVIHEIRTYKYTEVTAVYLSELTSRIIGTANIEYWCIKLKDMSIRRSFFILSQIAYNVSIDLTLPLDNVIEKSIEIQSDLNNLSNKNKNPELLSFGFESAISQIESNSKNKNGLAGMSTGFRSLDKITLGWGKSDLIIIGARPAMGKTAFMLSSAIEMAKNGARVCIFSLEMSFMQLIYRAISYESNIDSNNIKSGSLTHEEWIGVNNALSKLDKYKILVDDTSSIGVDSIKNKCIRLKNSIGLDCVIIDYLQIVEITSRKGTREQEVSEIARGLKSLAKELDIPVIVLSQLSRSVESRADKRPMLSDLRESGSLEQEANIVGFLYRPEYYGITQDENGESLVGVGEFIISKSRDGQIDKVKMGFEAKCTKYKDLVKEPVAYSPSINYVDKADEYEVPF